jgi:hypothetical protein
LGNSTAIFADKAAIATENRTNYRNTKQITEAEVEGSCILTVNRYRHAPFVCLALKGSYQYTHTCIVLYFDTLASSTSAVFHEGRVS